MNRIVRHSEEAILPDTASSADDPVARFARGEMGRREAMRALGIGYGALIDRLAARGLPLPELPAAEIERMAGTVADLLDPA